MLSAVQAAFWDNGYAGTSLDDLLAASGLGKGSLYGAFGDKQHLFLRCCASTTRPTTGCCARGSSMPIAGST